MKCLLVSAAAAVAVSTQITKAALPDPTQDLVDWQADEIGVIIHFNMATMAGTQGCGGPADPPPLSKWNATELDTDQWVEAMGNLGAKYAVYVAKHGCGFLAWESNVTLPFLPGPSLSLIHI